MRTYASVLIVVLGLFAAASPARAQAPHAASQSAIDTALQQHVSATEADPQAVLRLLEREELRKVAGQTGIDLRKATAAVATMSADDLGRVTAQAQQVEQALAGGQSRVVISTTMIIIVLLVVILLIVAID